MRWGWVESAAGGLITAAVAGIGMAAGFTHTHDAAIRAGQEGWLAWADAVVIECMVIVAGWQIHRDRLAGRSVRLPALVLTVAFAIQMGSQVSGAPATFAGWLFAAIPALGCLVVVKLIIRSIPSSPATSGEPVHVAAARDTDPAGEIEAAQAEAQRPSWPPIPQ